MMPEQQHHESDLSSFGVWVIWLISNLSGSSFSVIRRKVSTKVAAYHILLGAFLGSIFACVYYGVVANPTVEMGAVIQGVTGLMIFGLAVNLEKTEKRIEDVNLLEKTGIVTPESPPHMTEKKEGDHHG